MSRNHQSRTSIIAAAIATVVVASQSASAASFTSTSATGAWNTSRWNNSADAPPYTSAFTANNDVEFTSGAYTFAGMGATTNVGNVTVAAGVTVNFPTIGSTYATGGLVRTIDVGANGLFDLNGNSVSTAAGTGLIKSGAGVFGTGAGNFTGGFTLNSGTVIARGTTGLGSGGSNTLTLNGGVLAANNSRDFANTRFPGGITVGGNVQFGELATVVSIANSSANLSFANSVDLGSSTRTFTQGNNGTNTFSGIINSTSGGLTFAANPSTDGRFDLTNAANTFTGDININGGEVRFTADGSMGDAANDIIIDGGRFATANSASYTLGAGRDVFVGDGAGTSISTPGSGSFTIDGAIANKTGETGSWAKQGGGTLRLGGVSTYTGATAINNGVVRLTFGNDRLPTGTVVSLGQAASANLGTLDLNGSNQQIAGLNSTTGTNAGSSTNVVTSALPAVLTISTAPATSYTYSDGTAANSGVISGALSLVKIGDGTQILGGTNTYTGSTTINLGKLTIDSTGSINSTSGVTIAGGNFNYNATTPLTPTITFSGLGGTLSGTGIITSAVTVPVGNILAPGNSIGDLTIANTLDLAGASSFEINDVLNTADTVLGLTNLTYGGGLDVTNLGDGSGYFDGQVFDLFDFTSQSGTFSSITLPVLGGGLSWKDFGGTNFDYATGQIVVVPEPASLALLGLGSMLGLRRRRA